MKMSMNAFLLSLLSLAPLVGGQMVVQQGADVMQMVSNFLGDMPTDGLITVEDVRFVGDDRCRGIFSEGTLAVPNGNFPDEGIVLGTGQPGALYDQGSGSSTFCFPEIPGDDYLSQVVGVATFDACAVEIDFKVADPSRYPFVSFQYVFGSDEYVEFSNSQYNDAFALLLNGENLARVPGTNDIVSINSINQVHNTQYFNNNDPIQSGVPYPAFEADGFTDTLTAMGEVIQDPDAVNTLKLVIADATDCTYDSWVLLQKSSFRLLNDANVQMDPHVKTWGGETFDYMGECDLTLLENPAFRNGHGLYIDIRTTIRYQYSFIESAVVQIGEDKLEVSGYGEFALNEVVGGRLHHGDAHLSGQPLHYEQLSVNQTQFDIVLSPETNITIMTYKDFVNVRFSGGKKILGDSVGLMGSSLTGDMMSRNGKRMDALTQEHVNAWGQEWQVAADSPMRFMEPRSPQASKGEKCILPNVSPTQSLRRRLQGGDISMEEAKAACAGLTGVSLDACVGDVLALQDLGVAKAGAY